jgi:hypothetical protein
MGGTFEQVLHQMRHEYQWLHEKVINVGHKENATESHCEIPPTLTRVHDILKLPVSGKNVEQSDVSCVAGFELQTDQPLWKIW